MKKMFLATLVVGLMSTSVMALDGTIGLIKAQANGAVVVGIIKTDLSPGPVGSLVGTDDAKKAMLAIALTAKSSTANVAMTWGNVDGVDGWKIITLK